MFSDENDFDPSLQKAKDFKKFSTEPIRIPGTEVLTIEPKLTLVATKTLDTIADSLLDPELLNTIIENIKKTLELNLENKKSKLNYLKYDTNFKNTNNELLINSIHNEDNKYQPTVIITPNEQKGGNYSFFTEEECSFF